MVWVELNDENGAGRCTVIKVVPGTVVYWRFQSEKLMIKKLESPFGPFTCAAGFNTWSWGQRNSCILFMQLLYKLLGINLDEHLHLFSALLTFLHIFLWSQTALTTSSSCSHCTYNNHLDYFHAKEKSASDDHEATSEVKKTFHMNPADCNNVCMMTVYRFDYVCSLSTCALVYSLLIWGKLLGHWLQLFSKLHWMNSFR